MNATREIAGLNMINIHRIGQYMVKCREELCLLQLTIVYCCHQPLPWTTKNPPWTYGRIQYRTDSASRASVRRPYAPSYRKYIEDSFVVYSSFVSLTYHNAGLTGYNLRAGSCLLKVIADVHYKTHSVLFRSPFYQ